MSSSRRGFIALAGGAALAGCGSVKGEPQDDPPRGDLGVVNFALTLEYLEVDFYRQAVGSGALSRSEQELFEQILANETEHARTLERLGRDLGGKLVKPPRTDFRRVIGAGRDRIMRTAARLENTGAAAYLGQANQITTREVLAAALSIHTVEARQAATVDEIVGRPFLPDGAFADPLGRTEVMYRVEPFLV